MLSSSRRRTAIHPQVAKSLGECKRAFWSVAVFSGVVNALMLAGPLFMLQVYDRVLSSRSVPTLLALTIFLVGAYSFQAILDFLRGQVVIRAATLIDRDLSTVVHQAVVRLAVQQPRTGLSLQPVRDLDQIRAYLTGPGPIAIVDLPWLPVFLTICFLIHPWLGVASAMGAIVLLVLGYMTARASVAPARTVSEEVALRQATIEGTRRNSESIAAMGMASSLAKRWTDVNRKFLRANAQASSIASSYGSLTKVVRLLLQSAILGLGAYLVIQQELTAGSMIAASIMMGRALAPVEMAIGSWRSFISARDSRWRLSEVLEHVQQPQIEMTLPSPTKSIEVKELSIAVPGAKSPLLKNIQFKLIAGEALGIIGPSGVGKSSLVRTLIGVWPPVHGAIRLDGAALSHWDPEALGRHIGYVAQNAELLEGTVAENIGRMKESFDPEAVLKASIAAGAHDMIQRFPSGYDTRVGDAGSALSAGQRQRIALARALYDEPFLVVLDEPNSNLDNEGETALQQALRDTKARGAIVILIAHRPSALINCDKVLVLANGVQQGFGPRDEILRHLQVPVPASGGLKVVSEATGGGPR